MRAIAILTLTGSICAAQVIVGDPKSCAEADQAGPISIEDGPVRVSFTGGERCSGLNDKGKTLRVWSYRNQYQRVAAPKTWKISIEKGDGDRVTYVLPHNSVVGLTIEQPATGDKWKTYRGSSKNPIAVTQPAIALTLRKAKDTKAGGLKEEFLVWDVLTVDPLDGAAGKPGAFPVPAGANALRIEEVWVWQGLNPIPKKVNIRTGKGRVTFQPE